ncbi:MAG: thiol reductant ABC exporter subunit CydC [Treponema sp.]|jgi:ATP-binding cassette subfamily C protein|nr:thiol reductant ABC exporter subunit CydC [Treponema sp.]
MPKRMLALVRPLAHIMILSILAGTLSALTAVAIPILGAYALLDAAGLEKLTFGIIPLLAVFVFARGLLRYVEQLSGHYIAFRLLALIRDKVFGALRRLAPAKLEGREKGNLISIISSDIELLEVFYAHTIAPVAIAALAGTAVVLYCSSFHIIPGLILLAGYILAIFIIPRLTGPENRKLGQFCRKEAGALNTLMLDNLRGLGEIIMYGREEERMALYREKSEALAASMRKLRRREGLNRALTDAAILLTALANLCAGLWLWQKGFMAPGGIVLTLIASLSSFGPAAALGALSGTLVHTFAAAERVFSILDEEPAVGEAAFGSPALYGGICAENLGFAYPGGEEIIRDLSLQIPPDRILGIRGKSGCGKSSFLKLIMRFWDPQRGILSINGTDLRSLDTPSLRKLQGYVTQDTDLFQTSIAENIRIGREGASREEVSAAAARASLHDFVMTLPRGYDTELGELGDTLSSGERQRIGLARAFLHDGDILLLDEPTSNLDSLNEGIILKSVREQAGQKIVILVSHRLSTLGIADTRVSMDQGKLKG